MFVAPLLVVVSALGSRCLANRVQGICELSDPLGTCLPVAASLATLRNL